MPSHLRIGLAPGIWPMGAAIRLRILPRILQEERHSLGWPLYVYPGWCAGGCRLHSGHVSTEPLLVKIWIANRCAYMCPLEVWLHSSTLYLMTCSPIDWKPNIFNDNKCLFEVHIDIGSAAIIVELSARPKMDNQNIHRCFTPTGAKMQPTGRSSSKIKQLPYPWLVAAMHTTCDLLWLIIPSFYSYLRPCFTFQGWLHWKILCASMGLHLWLRSKVFPIGDARLHFLEYFGGVETSTHKPCSISFLSWYPWKKLNSKAFTTTSFTSVILRYIRICMQVPSWCGLLTGMFLMLRQKMNGWSGSSIVTFLGAKRTEPCIISWVLFCIVRFFINSGPFLSPTIPCNWGSLK